MNSHDLMELRLQVDAAVDDHPDAPVFTPRTVGKLLDIIDSHQRKILNFQANTGATADYQRGYDHGYRDGWETGRHEGFDEGLERATEIGAR